MRTKPLSHLTIEQDVASVTLTSLAKMARGIEEASTWLVLGATVILGAIVSNMDAVARVQAPGYLKWAMIALALSMIFGAIAKFLGTAVTNALSSIDEMLTYMEQPDVQVAMQTLNGSAVQAELAAAFPQPMKFFMMRAYASGAQTPLGGYRRLTHLLAVQIYASWIQIIGATAGIIILAVGLK